VEEGFVSLLPRGETFAARSTIVNSIRRFSKILGRKEVEEEKPANLLQASSREVKTP
jgi:hypothetical protein